METFTEENIDIRVAARASVWGVKVSANVESDFDVQQGKSFAGNSTDKSIYSIGAPLPSDGSAETWTLQAIDDPAPIQIQLERIDELRPLRNGELVSRAVLSHLTKALDEYCDSLAAENVIATCDTPTELRTSDWTTKRLEPNTLIRPAETCDPGTYVASLKFHIATYLGTTGITLGCSDGKVIEMGDNTLAGSPALGFPEGFFEDEFVCHKGFDSVRAFYYKPLPTDDLCSEQYGSNIKVCSSTQSDCTFLATLNDKSCDQYCGERGGSCIAAFHDKSDSCTDQGTISCSHRGLSDALCKCTHHISSPFNPRHHGLWSTEISCKADTGTQKGKLMSDPNFEHRRLTSGDAVSCPDARNDNITGIQFEEVNIADGGIIRLRTVCEVPVEESPPTFPPTPSPTLVTSAADSSYFCISGIASAIGLLVTAMVEFL